MSAPVRIRLARARGFNLQAESLSLNGLPAVNCARPGILGNPFVCDDPARAVEAFERYCRGGTQSFQMGPGLLQFAPRVHPRALHWAWPEWLREHGIPSIRGKNLACWCALTAPCHCDVLLRLSNPPTCEAVPSDGAA